MSRSQRKDIFRLEEVGIAYSFGLLRGTFNNIYEKFLLSTDRELTVDYFGAKIRKIKPLIKLVEGLKVKVTLFLNDPVRFLITTHPYMALGITWLWCQSNSYKRFGGRIIVETNKLVTLRI